MKVPQIVLLSANDCRGTYYSFRQYINEQLRVLCQQDKISAVRVVSCGERDCVVEYHVEIPKEEV